MLNSFRTSGSTQSDQNKQRVQNIIVGCAECVKSIPAVPLQTALPSSDMHLLQSSEKDQTFLWYQFCLLNLPHYHHIKMSRLLEQISLFIALEFINQLLLLKSQNCFLDFLVKTTKPSSNMTSTRNPSSGSQPWHRHFFWTLIFCFAKFVFLVQRKIE